MREPGSATRLVFEKALEKKRLADNQELKVLAYLESQEAVKEAVKAGLGLTVISRKAVQDELKAGQIEGYKLLDLEMKRNFYLVFWKMEQQLSSVARIPLRMQLLSNANSSDIRFLMMSALSDLMICQSLLIHHLH